MKKPVKFVGIGLIGLFVLAQFFQPERNLYPYEAENDFLSITMAPDTLATMMRNSCYDCHSDQTNYPWYSNISPVSWYLYKHIEEGKEELNLSQFGTFEKSRRIGALADICDVIESGKMPLRSYQLIHKDARMMDGQAEAICDWLDKEALRAMRE